MSLSPHLESHLCVRDGATKVVVCSDGSLHCITQSHWLRRSLDRHFVLGLLVLLNPEVNGSQIVLVTLLSPDGVSEILGPNKKLVLSKPSVFGQRPVLMELSVGSRFDFLVEEGLAPRVFQAHHEVAGGVVREIFQIVSDLTHPGAELHVLPGPVDRAVCDHVGVGRFIVSELGVNIGDEPMCCQETFRISCCDEPSITRLEAVMPGDHHSCGIGFFRKVFCPIVVVSCFSIVDVIVADELQCRVGDGLSRDGICEEVELAVVHRTLNNDSLRNPHHDACDVALAHMGLQKVEPRLFQGSLDLDLRVSMSHLGLKLHVPFRDLFSQQSFVVLPDQTTANIFEAQQVLVETVWLGDQVIFDLLQPEIQFDLVGNEVGLFGIAKREINTSLSPGDVHALLFQPPPVINDLGEPFGLEPLFPRAEPLYTLSPSLGGLGQLASILENLSQGSERGFLGWDRTGFR